MTILLSAALLLSGLYLVAFGDSWAPLALEFLPNTEFGFWIELIVPFLPMTVIGLSAVLFVSQRR